MEQASDYDVVKQAILDTYELVPEAYRKRFRTLGKKPEETHLEMARLKEIYFDKWCASKKINGEFEKLKHLILIEEFQNCVNDKIRCYLEEKDVSTLSEAAKRADEYVATHTVQVRPTVENKFQKKI